MSRYSDQIRDEYGRPVPGVSVYVYKWDAIDSIAGDLESLTDDLAAPLTNPVISDDDGLFYFNSSDGQKLLEFHFGGKVRERDQITVGTTIATISSVVSNAPIFTGDFYQATDADYGPALARAVAYAKLHAVNDVAGYTKASRKIKIPEGYFDVSSTTTEITHTVEIEGETSGASGVALATELYSAANTVFRVKADSPGYTGAGSILRGLGIYGGPGAEGEIHGVEVLASLSIDRCAIASFRGDGIHANATAGVTGNANHCFVTQSSATNCRNGIYVDGADTNAWTVLGFNAQSNRRWGIWDSSFLGNTYLGGESDSNGATAGSIPTVVTDGTFHYCVVKNQAAGASVNPPSTGVDNAYWYCFNTGGVDPGRNIDVWVSGRTYRDGGSVRGDGEGNAVNLFSGLYTEFDQGCPQVDAPALIIGGQLAKANNRGAPSLYTAGSTLTSSARLGAVGGLDAAGSSHTLGPDSGTATDVILYLQNTNNISEMFFRRWAGGHFDDGVLASTPSAFFVGALNTLILQSAGVETAHITSAALDLQSGKVLSNAGTQVLGPRETGWSADTGTAKKTATATYAVGSGLTVGAAYVQAEVTAIITRQALVEAALRDATQEIKALKDALIAHGAIGA